MKFHTHYTLLFLLAVLLVSCEKIETVDDVSGDGENTTAVKSLSIKPMTADNISIPYPITLYAFGSDGKCKGQTTLKAGVNRDEPVFKIPRGQYTVAALHSPESYPVQESSVTESSILKTPTEKYATEPMYLGVTNVNLTSNNQTTDVTLEPMQTMLNVSLSDVPSDIKEVSVCVNTPYTQVSFSGKYSSPQSITIPCKKTDDKWSTGDVYIFPTTGDHTDFTLSMKDSNGKSTTHSFTYDGALMSGTPYNFNGVYSDSDIPSQLSLLADIFVRHWDNTIAKSFYFGPGASSDVHDESVIKVMEFPEDGDIWNGHIVALADNYGSECELILISRQEWTDIAPAAMDSGQTEAKEIARDYEEDGITGWGIPTFDDADILKAVYSDSRNFEILNETISQCKGTPLSMKNGTENVRYLCEDATKSFSFNPGTVISTAGISKKYSLRLVKYITLKK